MGRSQSIDKVHYFQNNQLVFYDLTPYDVQKQPFLKHRGTFRCKGCNLRLHFNSGSPTPYFYSSTKDNHKPYCVYRLDTKTIPKVFREVGENVNFNIHIDHFLYNTSPKNIPIVESTKKEKAIPEKTITKKVESKQKNIHIQNAFQMVELLNNAKSDATQNDIISNLIKKKIYYSPYAYPFLHNDFKKSRLKPFFFVEGRIHQDNFADFEKKEYTILRDYPYKDKDYRVHLRFHRLCKKYLVSKFKDITWKTRESDWKTSILLALGRVISCDDKTITFEALDIERRVL